MWAEHRHGARRWFAVSLATAFILWNARFDHGIRIASGTYLDRQQQYHDGLEPAVTIDEVMRPAVAVSARAATVWSLALLGSAAGIFWITRRLAPEAPDAVIDDVNGG